MYNSIFHCSNINWQSIVLEKYESHFPPLSEGPALSVALPLNTPPDIKDLVGNHLNTVRHKQLTEKPEHTATTLHQLFPQLGRI